VNEALNNTISQQLNREYNLSILNNLKVVNKQNTEQTTQHFMRAPTELYMLNLTS